MKRVSKKSIFIYPTDTLYGILGSALSKEVVDQVYKIKGRDHHKPFIILISSLRDLKKFDVPVSKEQERFLKRVWPGKVSIIFPCSEKKFHYLHRGTKSLAFRMPKKKSLHILLKKYGPMIAPSANPQGLKPAETIAEAKKYFGDKIDFYISGGRRKGKPSTVVSLLERKPRVIREGSARLLVDK
jgi:L-threonylcarbamoyladenylate synthase